MSVFDYAFVYVPSSVLFHFCVTGTSTVRAFTKKKALMGIHTSCDLGHLAASQRL